MPKALKQKQEYGIPLSRYTVFLQNCPLGHDPKPSVFLAPARRIHLCERSEQIWVRIFGAERVELARKRQVERYSPKAKFPFFHFCPTVLPSVFLVPAYGKPKDTHCRRNFRQIVLFIICLLYNPLKSTSFFLKPIDNFRIPLYNNMPLEIGSFKCVLKTPPNVQRV